MPPIAIPEMAPGTNRPSSLSRTPERASIHRKFRPPPTIAIPEMAPGTNRLSSLSRNPEGSSIHRKVHFSCCRSMCFISLGGELARTPSLTSVVPRDMAETYGRRAAAVAWDGGMGRHTALMGMGHAMSCSDTSTSDSRSDVDLVPRADMASSEVLPWPSI
ncbi:hypothetical protein B296_00040542 [Ensete ventricosum]|uniref:Uncharacterized protein n=1 Tax=Ensete ventricosum TaxID=4639 RepID=A0A426XE27_ENSVE|nr:hypothetical protein B296_00040542 [Ensete ventricosum]